DRGVAQRDAARPPALLRPEVDGQGTAGATGPVGRRAQRGARPLAADAPAAGAVQCVRADLLGTRGEADPGRDAAGAEREPAAGVGPLRPHDESPAAPLHREPLLREAQAYVAGLHP